MRCLTPLRTPRLLMVAALTGAAWAWSMPSASAADPSIEDEPAAVLRFVAEPPANIVAEPPVNIPADAQATKDKPVDVAPAVGEAPPANNVPNPSELGQPGKQSEPDKQSQTSDFDDVLDAGPAKSTGDAAPSLTPDQVALRDQIRRTLARYYQRPVNARDHSPWEVFHWVIAYNVDAQIHTRGPGGETANAVAWMCYNYPCAGQRLLALDRGRPTARYGVGLEGHPGQFLAILAQSRVMKDYPLRIDGRQFTVADLVETIKLNCNSKKELTFQLIALSHYLDLNETWQSRTGETWSVPRLIREEIASPIRGSACGGTHRLMGLTYCVKKRRQRGQPIDGEYLRAKTYIDDYVQFTLRMQNPDGSFSTEWFAGRGARPDVDRRVQTTGHILEWMVFAASEEQLHDPRIVKAVDYLSKTLLGDETRDWKIGPLGHALRSLSLYDRRVFKTLEARPAAEVARRERASPEATQRAKAPSGSGAAQPNETPAKQGPAKADKSPDSPPPGESTEETGPLFIVPMICG